MKWGEGSEHNNKMLAVVVFCQLTESSSLALKTREGGNKLRSRKILNTDPVKIKKKETKTIWRLESLTRIITKETSRMRTICLPGFNKVWYIHRTDLSAGLKYWFRDQSLRLVVWKKTNHTLQQNRQFQINQKEFNCHKEILKHVQ